MANPPEGLSDDFFEQILAIPPAYASGAGAGASEPPGMAVLQLSSGEGSGHVPGGGGFPTSMFPLGLSLEPDVVSGAGKRFRDESEAKAAAGKLERDPIHLGSVFPSFGHVNSHSVRPTPPPPSQMTTFLQTFHAQAAPGPVPMGSHPPSIRPRVRARRGQATDPHSIAERLRRERIAERMKALQELVPSCNKTDRAAMLDEIVDYVKFLRLQVKVLSMSRLGAAGAVAQLVADIPLQSVEGEGSDGSNMRAWEKWSNDGTERHVAKLMEEDVGAAMQFLQSKALCIMPISLATAIYQSHQPDPPSLIKPEPNAPS